jgi:hypothetical protein
MTDISREPTTTSTATQINILAVQPLILPPNRGHVSKLLSFHCSVHQSIQNRLLKSIYNLQCSVCSLVDQVTNVRRAVC